MPRIICVPRFFALVLILVAFGSVAPAAATETTVGFAKLQIPDGAATIEAGVWYPAFGTATATAVGLFTQDLAAGAPLRGSALPMVVISHGTGGDFASHSDTAFALARAGFVAIAITHTGDNWRDQSRALDVLDRARQLHVAIDYMLDRWHPGAIDPHRIGAFGHSSGGFTVLVAAGGVPDLSRIAAHCAAHPAFFDCTLASAHPMRSGPQQATPVRDTRIRAIAVAAPALGFTFAPAGLAEVTIPVQLWRADEDRILPPPYYADAVRDALPNPPEFHGVPHAGHFDFLAPCPAALAAMYPAICTEEPGFDRAAFHTAFNAALVQFFQRNLSLGN